MKKLNDKIEIAVEKTASGYSGWSESLGVFTTGKDIEELRANLAEALSLAYEGSGHFIAPENIHLILEGK